MEQTSSDIANLIAEKEKELKTAIDNQFIVEQQKMVLAKEILGLQLKKKDIEISCSKASHNTRQIQLEIKTQTQKFWAAKQSGL